MCERVYRCFLPDLTGFTRRALRRARLSTPLTKVLLKRPDRGQDFNPVIADYRLQGTAGSPSSTVTTAKTIIARLVSFGNKFPKHQASSQLAERVGFEPTIPGGITVFETVAFDHSATSPNLEIRG